ncbi:MAG: UDP-glucose 4-epimerase GalE [Candidatus Symbiodolus clandestinus]
MAILVTGGAGYIGCHTVLALLEHNQEVVVVDNLCNASKESLDRVEQLTGKHIDFYQADVRDNSGLTSIFNRHPITAVIHFAGLKAVGDSVRQPLKYYQNNVTGTLVLLEAMQQAKVHQLIFSSSATVYGTPKRLPLSETASVGDTTNPYGTSKWIVERLLQELTQAEPAFSIIALRYFNPVGAHESGVIGEHTPHQAPSNLMPYLTQVANRQLEKLFVFGYDYPTPDGTGIRDYIHVMDLAEGHLKALEQLSKQSGYTVYNLGTGKGYSVLEIVHTFEQISGQMIPYELVPRRAGDIAQCWCDPSLATQKLSWQATRNLETMLRDAWRWQRNNPNGYQNTPS